MKKLAIASASLALAAMPVVGVFAANQSSFTDHLQVTVEGGCTIETSATTGDGTYQDRNFSATIPAGTVGYLNDDGSGTLSGDTLTVTCNGADTTKEWTVTVTPPASGNLVGNTATNIIAPGAAVAGDAASGWAIQSNANGGTYSSNPWQDYAAAPTTASVFLKGALAQGGSGTFNPSYRVFIKTGQAPDVYRGDVVYSVTVAAKAQQP